MDTAQYGSRGPRLVAAAIICVAAAIVMMSPFMNLAHLASALHHGDGREQAWALAWVAHALTTMHVPFFDANMYFPARMVLAQQDDMLPVAIVGLPVWLTTHNAVLMFNVLQILGPAATAFAGFLLAYEWTKDWAASVAGGLAFGLSFFTMLHNAHLNLTWAPGLPLSMLFLERWWRTPTWGRLAALWAAAVFTVLTSGYLAVMLVFLLAIHAAVLIVSDPRLELRARVPQIAAGLAAGGALVWPLLSPYLIQTSRPGETATMAADRHSYFVPPENTWLGHRLVAHHLVTAQSIWGERTLYLGWTAMVLAVVGGITLLRERGSRARATALIVLLLVAAALSFGPAQNGFAPFDLIAHLPGFAGFRATARFALLVTLGVSMLAAAGLARIRRAVPAAAPVVAIGAIVLVLGDVFVVDFPAGHPPPETIPRVYALAHADGARAAVALPMYTDGPEHFKEGDYLLDSTTADFLPLANGIGRQVPPSYYEIVAAMRDFPSPQSAAVLRRYGITHVVLHRDSYPDHGAVQLSALRRSEDYAVVSDTDRELLLRVVPPL
jgi:hypothetical protein